MSRRRPPFDLDPSTGRPRIAAGAFNLPSIVPAAPQAAPALDQVVPQLCRLGVPVGIEVASMDDKVLIVARCGPVSIPVPIDPESMADKICPALEQAMAQALAHRGAAQAGGAPEVPAGCEDLLAEAAANVAGPAPDAEPDRPGRRLILLPSEAATGA